MISQHYIDSYKPQCFSHNKHIPTLPGQPLNKTFLTCMTSQHYIGSYQFSVLLALWIHTNIAGTTVKQYIFPILSLAPGGLASSMNRQPKMSTLEIPNQKCKFLTHVHTWSPVSWVAHNTTAKLDLLGWLAVLPVVVIHRVVLVSWRMR